MKFYCIETKAEIPENLSEPKAKLCALQEVSGGKIYVCPCNLGELTLRVPE